jgi:putative addiction module killer protein
MAYAVKQLDEFSTWLKGLKDSQTRQRLIKRLRKAQLGNLGDVEKVGAACSRCVNTSGLAGACTLSTEASC